MHLWLQLSECTDLAVPQARLSHRSMVLTALLRVVLASTQSAV